MTSNTENKQSDEAFPNLLKGTLPSVSPLRLTTSHSMSHSSDVANLVVSTPVEVAFFLNNLQAMNG